VKDDELPEKKMAPPMKDPLNPGSNKAQDSRIKTAIARGSMVTIEKLTETGDVQRGNCKRAVYKGATGEIVMTENPQVQRGNILHIATDPSTQMTFDMDGRLHTSGGRQRTVVLPSSGPGAAPGGATLPQGNRNEQR
jgi:lipopolysaccharide export system protein LptA